MRPALRVAFPSIGPSGRQAWRLDEVPDADTWLLARCDNCGVCYPDPFPAEDEIRSFYATGADSNQWEIEHYVAIPEGKVAGWADFADRLTRLNGGPGRALEVGCAAGHLLAALAALGWEVMGIEIAPKFTRELAARGLPHVEGTVQDLEERHGTFDVIVMIDVLEHLTDPVRELQVLGERLTDRGRLVVATCDVGSLAARWYRTRWRQYVVSHTFYWTAASLRAACARAGLRVIDLSSFRYWDPDPARMRRRRTREALKLLARHVLTRSYVPAAARWPKLHSDKMSFKVGDQPVMSEVALVVATKMPPPD